MVFLRWGKRGVDFAERGAGFCYRARMGVDELEEKVTLFMVSQIERYLVVINGHRAECSN
jgi:hypothetical protein